MWMLPSMKYHFSFEAANAFRLQKQLSALKDIDTEQLKMLGYEGSSYTLYEDDGRNKVIMKLNMFG